MVPATLPSHTQATDGVKTWWLIEVSLEANGCFYWLSDSSLLGSEDEAGVWPGAGQCTELLLRDTQTCPPGYPFCLAGVSPLILLIDPSGGWCPCIQVAAICEARWFSPAAPMEMQRKQTIDRIRPGLLFSEW